MKSIYLINPKNSVITYHSLDVYEANGFSPKVYGLNLAITTIATMAKPYLNVSICEEEFKLADLNTQADYIGLTGTLAQWERIIALSKEFRNRGKTVILGGPFASLNRELVRSYCDVLVIGEVELIYPKLFKDLAIGKWEQEYYGVRPDLSECVAPDLQLYPNNFTQMGSIQASRGCPFNCEFCDVIQYSGRKQRYKPTPMVIKDLDNLYHHGYDTIMFTDDNFTANSKKAKEILHAVIEWNEYEPGKRRASFITQISLDTANDPEMLKLLGEASFDVAFLGIETPNQESLKEIGKIQNLYPDLKQQIMRFIDSGLMPMGGIIIGFDHDTRSIFEEVFNFAYALPIPVFTINSLVALHSTPLFKRLANEQRIAYPSYKPSTGLPWDTNIIPSQMSLKEFNSGMKWLCSNLYNPHAYATRVKALLNSFNYDNRPWYLNTALNPSPHSNARAHFFNDGMKLIELLKKKGPDEHQMVTELLKLSEIKKHQFPLIFYFLIRYMQIRHLYDSADFYDNKLASYF